MSEQLRKTVLAIGGLDPSGGAGILVDGAAIRSLGLHCAAVCAIETSQDGTEFFGSPGGGGPLLEKTVRALLQRQRVAAVKTGALGDEPGVEIVCRIARENRLVHMVVDPVLTSTTGGSLITTAGIDRLREDLIPLARVVTPNMEEASVLSGIDVVDVESMKTAANRIRALGADAVLVKGGHLDGDPVDVLSHGEGATVLLSGERIDVGEVRGTGCALASLIAGHLALGGGVEDAVRLARGKLQGAIGASFSTGPGPRMLDLS